MSITGVCLTGASAHFFLNYAGRIAPAGLVSVVRASDIVWAYGLEILVFSEDRPNGWTWLGVSLVLGSLVAVGFDKLQSQKSSSSDKVVSDSPPLKRQLFGASSPNGLPISDEENQSSGQALVSNNNANKVS